MNARLPFFNWSIKKAQQSEDDSFTRARIGIMFTILMFTLLKGFIVIGFAASYHQPLQLYRALAVSGIYIALIKILLYKPHTFKLLAHIMIGIGLIIIWSNIFVYAHKINLATLQFVFMIVLSSFYTLGNIGGVIYSILSMVPVIMFLVFKGSPEIYFTTTGQEFASPGFEIIVILNFISIAFSHFLFYRAFHLSIKEKERLNSQLQLSIAEANKLAATRSNFLSTISHELRTPLNSVVGISELLIEDRPEERQLENLRILQNSAIDLLSLINNVLDFNKLDSDKLVLESVAFRLADFTQNICSGFRLKALHKNLSFVVDIDNSLNNLTIISDPTRLSQVIYNLVGNAVKFTETGGITVRLNCEKITPQKAEVTFSIIDTGPGIRSERHEAIFEMFTQAESHITRKYGGTGLGLAIVKQVLALFGSDVHLSSTPGKGSAFSFTISFDTTHTSAEKLSGALNAPPDLSNIRVLIAEDNEVNRLLIQKQLSRMKLAPVIVENGRLAYEACIADDFDVIFMDLHMPEMDGYEAIRLIRLLEDPVKAAAFVIAFTATVNEQEKIFDAGFDDFLHKPVNMSDLREKLDKSTMRRQAVV